MKIAVFVLQGLLALAFLSAGLGKLTGADYFIGQFASWGYPDWFRSAIGIAEVSGGLGLIVGHRRSTLAALAGAGLVGLMVGALYTHFFRDPAGPPAASGAVTLLILAAIVAIYHLRRTAHGRSPVRLTLRGSHR